MCGIQGLLVRLVLEIKVPSSLMGIVKRHPPRPGAAEGDTFTNGNFLYTCKFPLQREKSSVFRACLLFSVAFSSK